MSKQNRQESGCDMRSCAIAKIMPGDIILTNGRSFELGSLPIKIANFFNRGYKERGWTHAALYIGDDNVVEAFPGGIVKRSFTASYLNDKYNLFVLRHKKASHEDIEKVISFCADEEGKKYDFRALIYFLLYNFLPVGLHFILEKNYVGNCFNVNESYFCSELVATGFKEAGIYSFEREPYKVMPIDFDNYLWFDTVDKLEITKKENLILYKIKSMIFHALYLIAAIIFPFIIILLGILVLLAAILIINGLFALLAIIFGALFGQKKNETKDKPKDQ